MNEPTAPKPEDPLGLDNPGMGHNQPPEPTPYDAEKLAALKNDVARFIEVSDKWLKVDVNTDALASQLADQVNGLRKLFGKIEETRKEEKAPHLTAGNTVDAMFNPLKSKVEAAAEKLKDILGKYAQKKEAETARIRAEKEAEARRAEEEARLAAIDAERGDSIEDQVKADEAAKAAEAKRKEAAKPVNTAIKSASGAGRTMSTRKRKQCTMKNVRHLFMHYQHRQEVADLLLRLANAEANSKDFPEDGTIPGVDITITTKVV